MGIISVRVLGLYFVACLPATYGLKCTCEEVIENKNLTCRCDTVNPIAWYYDFRITSCNRSTCIPNSVPGYEFSHSGSTYTLSILNYRQENCELYYCKDQIALNVPYFPYCPVPITSVDMTKPNKDQTIIIQEGAMIEFQCRTSSGYPAAEISWYKCVTPDVPRGTAAIRDNVTSESVRTGTDLAAITTSTLRLYPSGTDNGYSIYCSANNTAQLIISKRQPMIIVLYAPITSTSSTVSANVTSRLQDFATLNLEISANPNPQASDYVWSKNEDGGWQIIEDSHMIRIVTKPPSANLLFVNVRISDFGEYKLAVKNYIGMKEQRFNLIPYDAPVTPTNLSYTELNDAPMLQWQPGFDGGLPQTFVIQLRKLSTDHWTETNITDTQQTKISVRLLSLESDTDYTARIYAFNDVGNSALTRGISFTTGDIGVPSTESVTKHTTSAVVIGAAVGGGVVAIGAFAFCVCIALRKRNCVNRDTGKNTKHQKQMSNLSSENKQLEDEHSNGDDHGAIDRSEQNIIEGSQYEQLGEVRAEPSTYMAIHSEQGKNDRSYEHPEQSYVNTELY